MWLKVKLGSLWKHATLKPFDSGARACSTKNGSGATLKTGSTSWKETIRRDIPTKNFTSKLEHKVCEDVQRNPQQLMSHSERGLKSPSIGIATCWTLLGMEPTART